MKNEIVVSHDAMLRLFSSPVLSLSFLFSMLYLLCEEGIGLGVTFFFVVTVSFLLSLLPVFVYFFFCGFGIILNPDVHPVLYL